MHWSQKYVGIPYSENDCAELAVRVQQEVFNKTINLPTSRADSIRGISQQITNLQDDFAEMVSLPVDGDAVLLQSRGRLNHIGIYCNIDSTPWVLHAMRNAGQVCLHRFRDLNNIGLVVEGFYRWK